MLKSFCLWLAATPLSQYLADHQWLTPTIQSVHLLAIATAMGSALMINLRLLGMVRSQSIQAVRQRYAPWLWWALATLAGSGLLLVIGEPARELLNTVFLVKMALVLLVIALTGAFERLARSAPSFASPHWGASLLALGSMAVWLSIVTAGRWIAYVR